MPGRPYNDGYQGHSQIRLSRPQVEGFQVNAHKLPISRALVGIGSLLVGCTGSIGEPGTGSMGGPGGPSSTGAGTTGGMTTGGVTTGGSSPTGGGPSAACDPAQVTTRIWRLNDKQYMKAAGDLVPNATVPVLSTPGRDINEFVSWEEQFPVQEAFAAQLSDVAYKTAALATANLTAATGNPLVTCAAGKTELQCAQDFVDKFAMRAFRRPLETAERDGLMAVYDAGVKNGTGFNSGIELVVSAVLQAPSFLYRTELGAGGTPGSKVQLTPFELASSLSFLMTNSIPDTELWQTALDGSLSDAAVLGRQVDRLLALPKVQDNLTSVFLGWVGAQKVLTIEKTTDDIAGQVFDDTVRQSMMAETNQFTSDVLWKGGTISDIFQSKRAFVDKFMAGFYGVTYSGQGVVQVDLPNRAGLLTRAGLIASVRYGHNPEVFRGQVLRVKVLCGQIPPPPPSVNIDAFNAQYGGLSTRERIQVRASQSQCNTCHSFMDTLGIAYDNYGAVGQVVTQVNGVAPDPAGALVGTDIDGAFTDVVDLSRRLATSKQAEQCVAQQMATYAIGRELGPMGPSSCAEREIAKVVDDSGGRASAMFRGVVLNPVFATRVVGGP